MASLSFATVAPGTAAAARHARGLHIVCFVQDSSRSPELKVALPELGWGVDGAGHPTLPVSEFVRIAGVVAHVNMAQADAKRVFGHFPQMEEWARIWDMVMAVFAFTGEAMPWPVFKEALLTAKEQCSASALVVQGDKFDEYDRLDETSRHALEEHVRVEEAAILAAREVAREATYQALVTAYNAAAQAYLAWQNATPRPTAVPPVPPRPSLETTLLPPATRVPAPAAAFAPFPATVADFADLRWSHLATRDGGLSELGEFLWYCEDWLSAESAFAADRPIHDTLATIHVLFPAGAARPAVKFTRMGKAWVATAFPGILQTWERPGTPRLVELSERVDIAATSAAELLRSRWHTAVQALAPTAALLGHERDERIAIDLLRDAAKAVEVTVDGDPTERHLRLVSAELRDSLPLIHSWKFPPRPAPAKGAPALPPQRPVPASDLVRQLERLREADKLAMEVAPRHASVRPASYAAGDDPFLQDAARGGSGSLSSHAKEMQAFVQQELRKQEFLDMERLVLAPILSGGDAVEAVQIALIGASRKDPSARPRAIFHQIIHGHIDSVVARVQLSDLVRKRGLAPVVLGRVCGSTMVTGELSASHPLSHFPLDTAWKYFAGSAKDDKGDCWAAMNIEDMITGPMSTAINPSHVHERVPSKMRYATMDSLATVLEPGVALFTLAGFEDSPTNSWRVAISEAKRFLAPLKHNRNAGRACRKFIIALLREAYVAIYPSRYSSDPRKHPPREFIQPGSPAVQKFAAARKVFARQCESAQQEYQVNGDAVSDDGDELLGLVPGQDKPPGGDWLAGRSRSPAPSGGELLASRQRVVERGDTLKRTDTGEEWYISSAARSLRQLGAPAALCVRWALLRSSGDLTDIERCPYLDCPTHVHRVMSGFRSSEHRVDEAGANAERNRGVKSITLREHSPARVGEGDRAREVRGRSPSRRDDGGRDRSRSRSRSTERHGTSRSPARGATASATASPPAVKPAAKTARIQR
jgi:hypothetical protein